MLMQPNDAGGETADSPLTYDNTNQVAQAQPPAAGGSNQPSQPAQPNANAQVAQSAIDLAQAGGDLLGPVQIQFIEGLDVIVLRGSERDVQRVMEIINQIEQLSAVTVPAIEVYPLKYVDSERWRAAFAALQPGTRSANRRSEHHAARQAERIVAGWPGRKRPHGHRTGAKARPARAGHPRVSKSSRSKTPRPARPRR